jgi:LacI family transcriptional regulator
LSFAGFDDIEWNDLLDTPVTCLAQPTFEIGRKAVESLLRRIADPGAEHTVVRLDPQLLSRPSIAPPRHPPG